MNLVTLEQSKRWLGIPPAMTDDDLLLKRLLLDAEQWAENYSHRAFKPIIETRLFDWIDAYNLFFNDDLCELITATNGDSALTVVPLTEFTYHPRRVYPKFGLSIKRGSSYVWEFGDTQEDAISLKAAWCCHDDWGHAWVNTNDVITATGGINAAETVIAVGNTEGASADNDEPRFMIGMLIKIESEWLEVIEVTSRTSITVTRGVLGSTAATHAFNTAIYSFKPMRGVVGAILAYVHWRYHQKDNRGSAGFNLEIPGDITSLLPSTVGAYNGIE